MSASGASLGARSLPAEPPTHPPKRLLVLFLCDDSFSPRCLSYFHADALAALLPHARVTAAPDSGFFYATDPGYPKWGAELRNIVSFMNATSGLDASCVAAVRSAGGDPATCAYPEVLAPHVTTPLFVMNGRFDPALDSISAGENQGNASHVREIGQRFLGLVNDTVLAQGGGRNAAFVTSCAQHCGQWAQGGCACARECERDRLIESTYSPAARRHGALLC